MNPIQSTILPVVLALNCAAVAFARPPEIELTPVVSLKSNNPAVVGAEIVAHDKRSQRLFVTTGLAGTVDVFSIGNLGAAAQINSIDVKPYGPVANSVAVFDGLVAAAVEAPVKTDNGSVVFFDINGNFKGKVTVGALPDMLTFSDNGKTLLVANEGEPNETYTVDPEGSVSIIDLRHGPALATVRTADFKAYDKATLVAAGVRIFGPNATAPQDLEPEFISISHDGKTAWVTLQENNAIATIDVEAAKVTDIHPLGYKDHSEVDAEATIYTFDAAELPSIGATAAGQEIPLGGFSGLQFEGINPETGAYKFLTHTDRGPNAEPTGIVRPFLLPNFTPEIIRFELQRSTGKLTITQRLPLQSAPGVPLSGRPNTALSADANQAYNDEVPVDLLGNVLPLDPLGADLEGIVVNPGDHSFWMVDEYRPAIYHFSPEGVMIDRFVPIGTAAAAGAAPGTFGTEALPAVLAQRRQNRGFEGIALDNGRLYAFVQSPLRNPTTLSNGVLNASKNVRVLEFNPATLATRQFIYILDNADLGLGTNTRADKIGDAVAIGAGEFLVVERDDDDVNNDAPALVEKKIYRFNFNGATDVTTKTGLIGSTGKTVDQLTRAELQANGIQPIAKMLHVDLPKAGYGQVQKVEGLTMINAQTLAVINDNDFGVANITVNPGGTFVHNAPPEPIQLGIIEVAANGLDASDRDTKINIRQWPVRGLFLPDGIASFSIDEKTYLITANEGDSRVYPTFSDPTAVPPIVEGSAFNEEARVSSLTLDPTAFPDGPVLKNNSNLGRLTVTKTLGNEDGDGDYDALYAFGARSFSIWNDKLELVFDSGEELERITAAAFPADFNSTHDTLNSFDTRSDNKGPEPEGVVLGKIRGRTYAFIGLERIGGVVVYDVSDPTDPKFIQYVNHRDFTATSLANAGDLGPEGLIFIDANDSPSRKPLLVVANEISGTTTVYEIEINTSSSESTASAL